MNEDFERLTADERRLISVFRSVNAQGKGHILEQAYFATQIPIFRKGYELRGKIAYIGQGEKDE